MQKLLFLTIYFTVVLPDANAQSNSGTIEYLCKFPSAIRDSVLFKGELSFNDSQSLFTYFKIGPDDSSKSSTWMFASSKRGTIIKISGYDSSGEQIYRDFRTRDIFFRKTETKPLPAFVIKDNWVEIQWTIKDELKDICGYQCQKAIGKFRGRDYIVWYTGDIPLNFGPWKLYGLPGMILEAEDSKNQIAFTANNICYPCAVMDSIRPPDEIIIKTIEDYVRYNDYLLENVRDTLQARAPSGVKVSLNNQTTPDNIYYQRLFNPEILFEWEKMEDIAPKKATRTELKFIKN